MSPLKSGYSRKTISANISRTMREKPRSKKRMTKKQHQKQAIAIALSSARRSAARRGKTAVVRKLSRGGNARAASRDLKLARRVARRRRK